MTYVYDVDNKPLALDSIYDAIHPYPVGPDAFQREFEGLSLGGVIRDKIEGVFDTIEELPIGFKEAPVFPLCVFGKLDFIQGQAPSR